MIEYAEPYGCLTAPDTEIESSETCNTLALWVPSYFGDLTKPSDRHRHGQQRRVSDVEQSKSRVDKLRALLRVDVLFVIISINYMIGVGLWLETHLFIWTLTILSRTIRGHGLLHR
jgi:hypothetical protein